MGKTIKFCSAGVLMAGLLALGCAAVKRLLRKEPHRQIPRQEEYSKEF